MFTPLVYWLHQSTSVDTQFILQNTCFHLYVGSTGKLPLSDADPLHRSRWRCLGRARDRLHFVPAKGRRRETKSRWGEWSAVGEASKSRRRHREAEGAADAMVRTHSQVRKTQSMVGQSQPVEEVRGLLDHSQAQLKLKFTRNLLQYFLFNCSGIRFRLAFEADMIRLVFFISF